MTPSEGQSVELRFSLPAVDGIWDGLIAGCLGLLGGSVGNRWLNQRAAKKKLAAQGTEALIVKVIDTESAGRREFAAANQALQERLASEIESRHRAEMQCAELKGRNSELERSLASTNERIAQIVRQLPALAAAGPATATQPPQGEK